MSVAIASVPLLIVEDDPMSRKALMALTRKMKFDAEAVPDLASARRHLAEKTPAILILDLMLPDGDGTELLAEIRRAKLPIIVAVVTGVSNQLKLHEVTAWKPDALFGKPIDVADFEDWLTKTRSATGKFE